jgi:Mrp family chromosome partitioning ATPase
VLGLADAPSLGAACDGTLMVVEAGRSRTKAIIAAITRIEASGAHLLGVLLTKATERSGGYGYGYGSGYGYGQGAYRYGVGKNQHEILMIPHQGDN